MEWHFAKFLSGGSTLPPRYALDPFQQKKKKEKKLTQLSCGTQGAWQGPSAAGRILPDKKWLSNPRFLLSLQGPSKTVIVLAQSEKPTILGIGFYVFKQDKGGLSPEPVGKSGFIQARDGT
jgi:hypothetical protein